MARLTTVYPRPDVGPLDNPLKGWAAYSESWSTYALPASMAFFYVSWRELEPNPGDYRFSQWESQKWNTPQAQGKHIVMRLYLDYPNLPTGVPQWVIDSGVAMRPYDIPEIGQGLAPDYDDPRLLVPLLDFIQAFGVRYNSNPRVAFVQLGTLGFWGEWHTWPLYHLFASEATQQAVVQAYRSAFPDKILLARYPYPTTSTPWMGYHDDMFPADTDYWNGEGEEWYFLPSLRRAGRDENWRVAAFGGEMVPNQGRYYLSTEWPRTLEMLRRAHISWIGPYAPILEPNLNATQLENARTMVRTMGYQYRILRASWIAYPSNLQLQIEGVNEGVAPFYYPWQVRLGILRRTDGSVVFSAPLTGVDIRTWLPGSFAFKANLSHALSRNTYYLALGIIDPWRNRPSIKFANRIQVINGWNVLGTITV